MIHHAAMKDYCHRSRYAWNRWLFTGVSRRLCRWFYQKLHDAGPRFWPWGLLRRQMSI